MEYIKKSFWAKKKVLITGVTGFKGSWLALILLELGVKVYGLGLKPKTSPSLYNSLKLNKKIKYFNCDINSKKKLSKIIYKIKPDIIFHFAAQSLVIESYLNPIETYKTNIIGTSNLFEIISRIKKKVSMLVTTTDKVYKNLNRKKSFKEIDLIGGTDPYSASKASSEIICDYYQFKFNNSNKIINIARSGNVIGGGDFAKNRIFPDIYKSILNKQKLKIRSINSVRPWQHVLEPLYGYIKTVEISFNNKLRPDVYNYGPNKNQILNLKSILKIVKTIYPKLSYKVEKKIFYESKFLSLNSSKIKSKIGYDQIWDIKKTVNRTMGWYLEFMKKKNAINLCKDDIKEFNKDLLK